MQDLAPFRNPPQFQQLRLLGQGGMGTVFEVEDLENQRRVALKVLSDPTPRALLRFKQEFRLLCRLHHPNLVRLYEMGVHENQWYYTMELIDGTDPISLLLKDNNAPGQLPENPDSSTASMDWSGFSLLPSVSKSETQSVLSPGQYPTPIPAPRAIACDLKALTPIIDQLTSALEFLHQHNIVHRDLKPANILIDQKHHLRLLDFGLASQLDSSQAISRTGSMLGTLSYMSPEQFTSQAISPATDFYALGCLLYQLLSGQLPHTGDAMQIMDGRLNRKAPSLSRLVPEVDGAISELCDALLQRDPRERAGLKDVRSVFSIASSSPSPKVKPVQTPQRRLIGCDQEQQLLQSSIDRALLGQMQVMFITGPNGVGKSSLAQEGINHGKTQGFISLRGQCHEREHMPFAAFDGLMDSLILGLSRWPKEALKNIQSEIHTLKPLFPAIGAISTTELVQNSYEEPRRERLEKAFDGFCSLISHCQSINPLLLVLDDLQWADNESKNLIERLLQVNRGRLFLLCIHRDAHPHDRNKIDGLNRVFSKTANYQHIDLKALNTSDCKQLISQESSSSWGEELQSDLIKRTGGNPYLLLQSMRYIRNQNQGAKRANPLELKDAEGILSALITQNSPLAQKILDITSVSGQAVSHSMVQTVGSLTIPEIQEAFTELLQSQLLMGAPKSEDPQGNPVLLFDFVHSPIRTLVYNQLDPTERRQYHQNFARYLENKVGTNAQDITALFYHWTGAGNQDRQRQMALKAAEVAASKLALRRAALCMRQALEISDDTEAPATTAKLWSRAGDFYEDSGQYEESAYAYRQALLLFERADLPEEQRQIARLRLWGRIGENLICAGDFSAGQEACDNCLNSMDIRLPGSVAGQLLSLGSLRLSIWLKKALSAVFQKRQPTPWDQARAETLAQLLRAIAAWPLKAAQVESRYALLDLKIKSPQIQFLGVFHNIILMAMVGSHTTSTLEKAQGLLDRAEHINQRHTIPLGQELILFMQGTLWLGNDLDRAEKIITMALAGLRQKGQTGGYYWAMSISMYCLALWQRGHYESIIKIGQQESNRPERHVMGSCFILLFQIRSLCRLARISEAKKSQIRLNTMLLEQDSGVLSHLAHMAQFSINNAEGKADKTIQESITYHKRSRGEGRPLAGILGIWWLEITIEAGLLLRRSDRLKHQQKTTLMAWSKKLVKSGTFSSQSLGYRAMALLLHDEKRLGQSKKALHHSLQTSSQGSSPFERYSCLETAQNLGYLPLSLKSEYTQLAKDLESLLRVRP